MDELYDEVDFAVVAEAAKRKFEDEEADEVDFGGDLEEREGETCEDGDLERLGEENERPEEEGEVDVQQGVSGMESNNGGDIVKGNGKSSFKRSSKVEMEEKDKSSSGKIKEGHTEKGQPEESTSVMSHKKRKLT